KQTTMPRFSSLKNLAVVADIIINPAQIRGRHKKGVHVLYGHAGAKWVPLEAFPPEFRALTDGPTDADAFTNRNDRILLEYVPATGARLNPPRGAWAALDRY
ncbi:MAG: hypothetical protein NZ561_06600, partial [Phycisphaerae bacterium]|nr:hypothetical protein [Phycisphaerae bacterium]MDW8263128.1 hypothetical protein [Phycisphaerales bacterium]